MIDELPVERFYQSVALLLPGVAGGEDGNPNTSGALRSSNLYLVDGIDTSDPTTGLFGLNLSYEAVQEVQVTTAAPTVDYGRSSRAVINVLTRSGDSRFRGGVRWVSGGGELRGDYETAADRTHLRRGIQAANLGPPSRRHLLLPRARPQNCCSSCSPKRVPSSGPGNRAIWSSTPWYVTVLTWDLRVASQLEVELKAGVLNITDQQEQLVAETLVDTGLAGLPRTVDDLQAPQLSLHPRGPVLSDASTENDGRGTLAGGATDFRASGGPADGGAGGVRCRGLWRR